MSYKIFGEVIFVADIKDVLADQKKMLVFYEQQLAVQKKSLNNSGFVFYSLDAMLGVVAGIAVASTYVDVVMQDYTPQTAGMIALSLFLSGLRSSGDFAVSKINEYVVDLEGRVSYWKNAVATTSRAFE